MASTIIQVYLKQVLESFFHSQSQVRMCALGVITLILGQGLVHPVQVTLVIFYSGGHSCQIPPNLQDTAAVVVFVKAW